MGRPEKQIWQIGCFNKEKKGHNTKVSCCFCDWTKWQTNTAPLYDHALSECKGIPKETRDQVQELLDSGKDLGHVSGHNLSYLGHQAATYRCCRCSVTLPCAWQPCGLTLQRWRGFSACWAGSTLPGVPA